ncbi:hypothetical protein J7T55_003149 [Diaporthe amygdali]|uniref:uncharacterized protein n=1 Tax=Phomopsis amygdali TaxID=1214568 RepID=UPI0022FE8441|nr:uncharacterized protein J7T55_003149 [Diaporthe amygdali]KAJ0122634.1 hypothetical protein J7T55_003149 [Diaporthe amygdali]
MTEPDNLREDVPFLPLLAGLAAWPLYRLAIDRIVRWWSPEFYTELRSNYEKKYLFFFGILLGLIVKPIPLISCGLAVWKTAPEDDIAGFRRPMNPSQQFCWGSRTVIYISEMPHYLHIPEMLLHHLLVLLGMSMVAKFHICRRGLDLSLAALWSEIIYSLRNVLKWTGHLQTRPNLDWGLTFYGTIFLFVTRAPTTIMALAMIPASGLQAGSALVIASAYLFHLVYIIRITFIRLKKSGVLQVEDSGVFRVQMGARLNITSATLLTGAAFMGTQVSVVLLYSWKNTTLKPVTTTELTNLMWNSLLAGTIGLAGSRLIAAFLRVFIRWHWMSLLYTQCDLAITALVLFLSPTIEGSIDKSTLLSCLLLSSSLTKAVSQYACHLSHLQAKPQVSSKGRLTSQAELNSSIINLCQYFVFVLAVGTGLSSVAGAAFKTFVVQLVVEAAADPTMSKTSTGISMGSLAVLMTVWRFNLTATTKSAYSFDFNDNYTIDSPPVTHGSPPLPYWLKFLLQDTLVVGGLYVMFSSTTIRYFSSLSRRKSGIPGLPRLRTVGLLTVFGWVSYIVYLVSTGQTPEIHNKNLTAAEILAREPQFCSLLLSWQFWASITASAIVPTAIAHLWRSRAVGQEHIPGEAIVQSKTKEG